MACKSKEFYCFADLNVIQILSHFSLLKINNFVLEGLLRVVNWNNSMMKGVIQLSVADGSLIIHY